LEPRSLYTFHTDIRVRVTDLNFVGHLANDRLLSLVHEARVAFLAEHDWNELNCAGVSLLVADTAVVYEGEAFAGDVLRFDVTAGEPTGRGFRLFYRIIRSIDDAPIALVENGMVCFDYETRKTRRLPDAVRVICQG
jgi:acyl-CoA thioesterase FadM